MARFTDEEKEALIAKALETRRGRLLLAWAMVRPIRNELPLPPLWRRVVSAVRDQLQYFRYGCLDALESIPPIAAAMKFWETVQKNIEYLVWLDEQKRKQEEAHVR
jgi:hypothetical protein